MIGSRLRQGSCRLCLWESNSLWDIFGELAERRNFVRKIEACVNINVSKDDGLSSLICPNCIYKIELFYDFQTSCKRSDEIQKLYNGYQDGEYTDCDDAEDVHPTLAAHCPVSNSHKDAHGPVETIDIKEEPIDDYEGPLDGVGNDQFEDAEVEVEVVTVEEDRPEEGVAVTEHHQQNEKDKRTEGEGGGNGSCMQLTPPRSPSVTSDMTYSASEAGGTAESDSPEEVEQQQQQQSRGDGRPEGSGGGESGGRCAECLDTCQERERSCSCRNGADRRQCREEAPVDPKLPPPTEHNNRCRFCKKWFQTVGLCRTHETECTPPQQPGTGRRCRFCSVLFLSEAGRTLHEDHCVLRERQAESTVGAGAAPQAGGSPWRPLPPPPKYLQQCRFCRKYFPRLHLRRMHELECGIQSGYTLAQLQTLNTPTAVRVSGRRCSICRKLLKSVRGRQSHEYYCLRDSGRVRSHVSTPKPHGTDVATRSDGPEANPVSASGGQDVIKCRYCGKGHLKWRSLMTHEFHCRRKVPPRAEANAEVVARTTETEANPEVPVSGKGNGDESGTLARNTVSENRRQGIPNRCSYCHKWFQTRGMWRMHEYYCSHNVRMSVRGRYACSFCPRRFQKRSTYHMHKHHCYKQSDRTGDSATANRAEPTAEQDRRQLPPTDRETSPAKDKSGDRQEVISPGVPEPERKRKKVHIPVYTPLSDSTKVTDVHKCQYCDRIFKYRECLRSHEVTCSAIATYQYSMPYQRLPSFSKCPLCGKVFRFRRMLSNHWKVCEARMSVLGEASELYHSAKLARDSSAQPEGSGTGGAVMPPFGDASSPGEDREEWRGWPSSQSPTLVDLLTDEDSSTGTADSSGLSCKHCKKNFCSRVLLELHTLNECVYQRIRNDHAYAQCESSGVDESTLMRMARVELQRLLLCSCCGSIFTDRQALAEHEQSERQRHGGMPSEADNLLQCDSEATHIQKRIKLGKAADESGLKQEGDRQDSSCTLQQQTVCDRVVPTKITKLVIADSRQESKSNCLLRDILCNVDNKEIVRKVASELQTKEEVSIKQQERHQLGSIGLNDNSVLRDCVGNNCNLQKLDLGEKVSSVDNGLKQDSQIVVNPQYQECPSNDHKQQLQNNTTSHSSSTTAAIGGSKE